MTTTDSHQTAHDFDAADPPERSSRVIYFDGVCGLCNSFVDFVMKRDTAGRFRFSPLQSDHAAEQLPAHGIDPSDLDSVVLLEGDHAYQRSDAALRVLSQLGGVWKAVGSLSKLPSPLRDTGYRLVANARYRLFGKKETCRMPTPAERDRFIL